MPDLFGIDIAQTIADAMDGAGGLVSGTLTVITSGARGADPTGGTNPTTVTYTFQGILEQGEVRRGGQVGSTFDSMVTIITKSISVAGVVPRVNDQVTIEGQTFRLIELMTRDPAGATYKFRVEE